VVEIDLSFLKFQLEADIAAMVQEIRDDAVAGPIELARRGAATVLRLTDKVHYERPLQINLEVQGLARALLEARSDSMPLANLASLAASPLPELYGRGKDEGARMRADLRMRISEWLSALEERAARIDAVRDRFPVVNARAIDCHAVYWVGPPPEGARYAIGGHEKFVPPNYDFDATGLQAMPLDQWDGFITGDCDKPVAVEFVRNSIAALRFETSLL
jgi:hypothetical protein